MERVAKVVWLRKALALGNLIVPSTIVRTVALVIRCVEKPVQSRSGKSSTNDKGVP
jgi:hypothetical protein